MCGCAGAVGDPCVEPGSARVTAVGAEADAGAVGMGVVGTSGASESPEGGENDEKMEDADETEDAAEAGRARVGDDARPGAGPDD